MLISTIIPLYYGKKYISKQIKQIEIAAKNLDGDLELIFVNDAPDEPIDDNFTYRYTGNSGRS